MTNHLRALLFIMMTQGGDVTSKMKIDSSNYNKNRTGTYTIEGSYKKIKADFEVDVVDKITNSTTINQRLSSVIDNSFRRHNNILSFEATRTSELLDTNIVELLVFVDNVGQIFRLYKMDGR